VISMKIVKWLAASAIALSTVPAIGLARHASHVSAGPALAAVTTATPAAESTRVVKHPVTKAKIKHRRKHKAKSRAHKATKSHKTKNKSTKKKVHAK
jgi:hypothetical protein